MATILKVQYGSDIRRLNLTHFSSYADFVLLVRTIFNISELSGLQLMYQDEDKDFINIRSDMDFMEARRYAEQLPSFKIHILLSDGISSSPRPAEVSYPQLAPEDVEGDLTSSFAELLSESMKKKEEVAVPAVEAYVKEEVAPEPLEPLAERTFVSERQERQEPGVIDTMEVKFKKALEALVEFVESLHLDVKVKQIVAELEPSFAKFEEHVLAPINEFGLKASRGLQSEMETFQGEVNQLKERLNTRFEELKRSRPSSPAPSAPPTASPAASPVAPSVAPPVASAPPAEPIAAVNLGHNAVQDLQHLEAMGFTNRRRNLELLASHKGDLARVIDQLLA